MNASPIRVLLADDHAVVRQGIRQFLEASGEIVVLAEAGDGEQALRLVREHRPDVAVLDIQMPRLSGIDVARAIRTERLPVGVLILTAYDDEPYIRAVLQAGANGYVMKTADADDIVDAVRSVNEGKSVLDPSIARRLMSQLTRSKDDLLAVEALTFIALLGQPLFLAYFVLYNTYTLSLIALSAGRVRRRVASHFVEDLDLIDGSDYTKPLTMIVPSGIWRKTRPPIPPWSISSRLPPSTPSWVSRTRCHTSPLPRPIRAWGNSLPRR